jgi:tRNA threonylcarbamoyladenosine biosynthesis protein TsaE
MILGSDAETRAAGAALSRQLRAGDIGAGKTTFVRGLLAALGHSGEVPSPTFAIVQPYDELRLPVWHADLYRIEGPGDLDELGLESILDEGALVVEWPGRAGETAFPTALALSLDVQAHNARRLTAKVPPAWEGRWPLP